MAVSTDAPIQITAFSWVPEFARGVVRDLRVRWALEEAGLDYRVRMFDGRVERPADYFLEQPFGQVPAFREGETHLFESGAIVLHIAGRSEALAPSDPNGRARTVAWVIAALNSVEPMIMDLAVIDLFSAGQEWARLRRPDVENNVRRRLKCVSDWLGDSDYLEDRFTAGDLIMTTVLRNLRHTNLVAEFPNLAVYLARCEARPAFQRALAAQLAGFEKVQSATAA